MPTEITALLAFCATLLATILLQALVLARTEGLAYVLSNRASASASPLSDRLARVLRNSLEAAAIFTPLVLIAAHLGVSNAATQWAAIGFAASRIAYAAVYAVGLPGVRSLVWNIGFVCLVVLFLGIATG